jgi:hypothetical protein
MKKARALPPGLFELIAWDISGHSVPVSDLAGFPVTQISTVQRLSPDQNTLAKTLRGVLPNAYSPIQ